jgi:2-polyprenyl-3-methyl-5-hydroxy-6-metoxy-1,4-benzoquinol methylase
MSGSIERVGNVDYEDGLVVGTAGKYQTKNPIALALLAGFDRTVAELSAHADPRTIMEIGCGEGHTAELMLNATKANILATDISTLMVTKVRAALPKERATVQVFDVMADTAPNAPDLVACLEVLEHLTDPEEGLDRLLRINAKTYLLSVPREPIWRAMNMARGAYLSEWGNSPGHLNHWSKSGFLRFIERRLRPIEVRSPLPWTFVLAVPR